MKKIVVLLSACLVFLLVSCDGLANLGLKTSTETGSWADLDGTETVTGTKASETEYMQFTFDEEQFNQEYALWKSLNIHDYSFEQSEGLSLTDRFLVTVEDGSVVREDILEDSGIVREFDPITGERKKEATRSYKVTIDGLFYYAAGLAVRYKDLWERDNLCDGTKVVVTYDPVYHFPVSWDCYEYHSVKQDVSISTTIITEHTLTGSKEISRTTKVVYHPVKIGITYNSASSEDVQFYDFTPANQPLD
jgi:hypothetical protein